MRTERIEIGENAAALVGVLAVLGFAGWLVKKAIALSETSELPKQSRTVESRELTRVVILSDTKK